MPLRIQPQIQLQTTATEHEMMITGRGTPTHTLTVTLRAGRITTFVNTHEPFVPPLNHLIYCTPNT